MNWRWQIGIQQNSGYGNVPDIDTSQSEWAFSTNKRALGTVSAAGSSDGTEEDDHEGEGGDHPGQLISTAPESSVVRLRLTR